MDLSCSASSFSLKEFRELAWKGRSEITIAQVSVSKACETFAYAEDWVVPEQCDFAMLSVRTLREATQQFSALLCMTTILPYSIWSMRYSLLTILCNIDEQMRDLVLQLRILRKVSPESLGWIKEQQQMIQCDLQTLLEDSNNSVMSIGILLDQASFIEGKN